MSGLVNKIKEAVHSDKADNSATNNPQSSNAGPHASNVANKADPRVDSDRDNFSSGTGTTGATGAGYGSSTTGTTGTTGSGFGSSNAGPHSSNLANKADPRVDSDRDGRGIGSGTTGAGYGSSTTTGTTGTSGFSSTGTTGGGYGSSNAGPHSSNLANKADPRVDSDRDGRGIGSGTAGTSGIGSTGTTGAGYGSSNAGPHSSNLANKADPRVDSDRDGRGIGSGTTGAGYGSSTTGTSGIGSTGTTGTGYGSSNAGPHSSNLANKADPRIDSDLDGNRSTGFGTSGTGHGDRSGYNQGTTGAGIGSTGISATPGSGNASKTAGPHNSDLLNKLDPRVDSDLDGSKTVGGNATHQ